MAVKTPADTEHPDMTADRAAEEHLRELGQKPMLPNDEHIYGFDGDPRNFERMKALEQSGQVAGFSGRRDDNDGHSNLTPEQRAARDAVLANLLNEYNSLAAELDDLNALLDQLDAELQERLDAEIKLDQEKLQLQTEHDIHEQLVQEQEQTVQALDRESIDIDAQNQERYQELADIGLPQNVLTAMYFKDPNSCSRGDAELAVNYDEKTQKFFYVMPDGSSQEVLEPMSLAGLRQQLQEGRKSANQLTGADATQVQQYTRIAGEVRTTAETLVQKWKALGEAEGKLAQYKEMVADDNKRLEDINRQIEENKARIAELQVQRADTAAKAAEKRAQMDALEAKARELGGDLEAARAKVAAHNPEELTQLQQNVTTAQQDFDKAYKQAAEQYDAAITDMTDLKKELKENKIAFISRDVQVMDEKGQVVKDESGYPVTKHLELPVQEDERGYFYTDPYGQRKTIAPQEVSYLLANGSKTVQDLKDNPDVQSVVRQLGQVNTALMKNAAKADAAAAEGIGNAASAARFDTDNSRTMLGSMSEERAQFLTAQEKMDKAVIDGKITQSALDKALLSVDADQRDSVRQRLLEELERSEVAVVADPQKAKTLFAGIEPQVIPPVSADVPRATGESLSVAQTKDVSFDTDPPGLKKLTDTGAFGKAANPASPAEAKPDISAANTDKLNLDTPVNTVLNNDTKAVPAPMG